MQQSVVKFYYLVTQTLLNMFRASLRPSSEAFSNCSCSLRKLRLQFERAPDDGRNDAEVNVFPAVVGLLTNRPRLETHPPRHLYGNRRLRLQFERVSDDGRNDARNMLSSLCVTM
jgi:hypothetical protein